jgi:outer membrane protein assembly factor BamE (lipoprotein component of BamABCDE complex)
VQSSHPSPDRPHRRAPGALSMLLACVLLAGCSLIEAPPQVRGNRVDPDQLKELTPGTSTRADATALLGSPTAKATFDDNIWLYIGEVTQPRIARTQAELSQDVVVLNFDDRGVLQSIKHMDKDDSIPVSVVSRATPSPGSEASFMQQLFGNVGRFTAAPIQGGSAPSGGAPNAGGS